MSTRPAVVVLLLGLLAAAAAVPRFGQRENPSDPLSDSDYYLDMAEAFAAGGAASFDSTWTTPGHPGSKHYTRPLLPLLAAGLDRLAPVGVRAAFSIVDVLAAWTLATALFLFLRGSSPGLRHAWLPSALFLTGLPQINWGYHILTDTLGYATAFLSALGAWALLRRRADAGRIEPAVWLGLVGVFGIQAVAYFARESAWMAPVVVGALMLAGPPGGRRFAGIVLAALVLAALPHALWVGELGVERTAIPLLPNRLLAPDYLLGALGRSLLAFHLMLPLAILGAARSGLRAAPPLLLAWSVAALLYMAAGYAHNTIGIVGYPLRLTYALFPLVYFEAARGLEALRFGAGARAALVLVVVNASVGVAGVALDPTSGVRATAPLRAERRPGS